MNRHLLSLAILAGGSCFGATLINASGTEPLADEQVSNLNNAVYGDRQKASSAAAHSMTNDNPTEKSVPAIGSQRDYRRELQYDKNILEFAVSCMASRSHKRMRSCHRLLRDES